MNYKGYSIDRDREHYLVTGPEGMWTEDTVQDAKESIDQMEKEELDETHYIENT